MGFIPQEPRAFTREAIEAIHPNQYGVYGIFRQGQWVYVGQGDIRERLLSHLRGDNPCINSQRPSHWVAELSNDMDRRERELILELSPACNRRVG